VQVNGRRIYLGKFGTAKSRERYRRTIAEWISNGSSATAIPSSTGGITVKHLILAYWRFARGYYQKVTVNKSQAPVLR
jgi:hypothetical protein